MRRRDFLKTALTCMGLVSAGMPAWAAETPAEAPDPYTWLVDLVNLGLDEIRADPRLQNAEAEALRHLVDERIMPNVDFTMMTRMTIGPRWRTATKEQRERLKNGFKKLLVRVYSGALKAVKENVCELRPSRNRRVADEMVVRTILKSPGEPDIAIDYRIYKNKHNEWKIVDVNVEGVWMVENYRSQFASTLSNDGIDGLIELLEERTDELAGKNKSGISDAGDAR